MKFPTPVSIKEIALMINATIDGNADGFATGINEIHKVESGDIVFVDHPKYYQTCFDAAASFIIIDQYAPHPESKTLLITEQPFEAYLTIVNHFKPFRPAVEMISSSAVIDNSSYIAPNVFVGEHVVVGKHCYIHPNVTIMHDCEIGDDVIVQSGTVIGSDAFYYNGKKNRDLVYKKMNSCGKVVIQDGVEIGAGCTIDRGVTHETVIGRGTKIDNQVHIGHDVVIGSNCLIAAQVGIAGASTIEDNVILWGQVGVNKTTRIGKGTVVMGQSGVISDTAGGKIVWGTPAIDLSEKKRQVIWMKRLPELWKEVKKGTGNKGEGTRNGDKD